MKQCLLVKRYLGFSAYIAPFTTLPCPFWRTFTTLPNIVMPQSEHFDGFLEPNRSGDSDDDYGYNALGSEEGDDGEHQHEESVGAPLGDVKCETPGGFGIEGEAGGEACDEGVALRQGSEELLGDRRRLRGSGIEPGHVEVRSRVRRGIC